MMIPLAFLSVFALYLSTLYPAIAPEDSGEFVTAAWTLGIPHASGYSLYALMGKAAAFLIPFANPAYRVNVLSALLGAGTFLLFADALKQLSPQKTRTPDILADLDQGHWKNASLWTTSLLWALIPGVWYLSLLAEVYILETFLGVLCVWSVVRWKNETSFLSLRETFSQWSLSSFLLGIGLSVHHTLVLWTPGLLNLWFARHPSTFAKPLSTARGEPGKKFWRLGWWKPFLLPAGFFLSLGFSVQLYLFLRSQAAPLLDTGSPDDGIRWIRVLLRLDYGAFSLAKETLAASRGHALKNYFLSLAEAFTPFGLIFVLWGACKLLRQNLSFFSSFFLLWIIPGPLFIILANPPVQEHFRGVMERFYLLSYLGPLFFLGWGLYEAGLKHRWIRRAGLLLVPLSLASHLYVSGRGNLHARDFGANLLKSMPPNSILWDPGDSAAYSVLFQQTVAGNRPDVASVFYHTTLWGQKTLRARYPDLLGNRPATPAGAAFEKDFLPKLLAGPRGELLCTEVPLSLPGLNPNDRLPFRRRYPDDAFPLGLAYRYFPADSHKLVDPNSQLSLSRLTFWWYRQTAPWRLTRPGFFRPPTLLNFQSKDPFTAEILRRYAEAHTNLGQKFAQYQILDAAEEEYNAALNIDPEQMEAYNNLGVLAYGNRDGRRAAAFFKRALSCDPGNVSLMINLGLAHRLAGQTGPALAAFQTAERSRPNAVDILYPLAELLMKENRFEEALNYWKRLRDMSPDDKTVYWHLSQTYAALHHNDKALESIGEYLLLPLSEEEKSHAEEFRSRLLNKNDSFTKKS